MAATTRTPDRSHAPIVTLTVNPALDLSTSTERLEPEHKLRCGPSVVEAGGGGVNVSRVIARLGGSSTAVVAVGGATGGAYRDLLAAEAAALVRAGLEAHQVFRAASLVRRMRDPMFARYETGEEYGLHVDDALMGSGPDPLRTDLSVTVFLSPPTAYDGGELVLDSPAGEQTIKLDAGSAVLYPSTFLHRVAPVTRGERRVAVTWVQSLVRSAEQRAILFDLDQARRDLFAREGRSPAFDLIAKSYANLLRLWAES